MDAEDLNPEDRVAEILEEHESELFDDALEGL